MLQKQTDNFTYIAPYITYAARENVFPIWWRFEPVYIL